MLTVSIHDPQNFQLASPVIKDSKTGISTNKRLLVLKGGHLYYYSSVPKSFDGDPKILDYHHELPKGSIDVLTIKRIRTPATTSPDFQVIFESCNLMERQDIRKTVTSQGYVFTPKETKEETVWRFTCDNHFIKEKWIASILSLIKHYQTQHERINKYFNSLGKQKDKQGIRNSSFGRAHNPWKAGERKNDTRSLADRLTQEDLNNADWSIKKPESKNFSNTFTPQTQLDESGMSFKETGTMEHASMKRRKGGFD